MSTTISDQTVWEWTCSPKAMRPKIFVCALISLGGIILLIVLTLMLRQAPGAVQKATEAVENASIDAAVPRVSDETAFKVTGYMIAAIWIVGLLNLAILWGRFAWSFLYCTRTLRYTLNSSRVDVSRGFGTPTRKSIDLVNLEGISWGSSPLEKLLGCGTGTVTVTANANRNATKTYVLTLFGLENPEEVYGIINKARIDAREREGIKTVRDT